MHNSTMAKESQQAAENNSDGTLAYMRALTTPLMVAPCAEDLRAQLLTPWNVRLPVDTSDPITLAHWKDQSHTPLFETMMDWKSASISNRDANGDGRSTVKLQPYFSFSDSRSPFFDPHHDVANCLKHLLLHQVGIHESHYGTISLISHETHLFLATSSRDAELAAELDTMVISESFYLLRYHYDQGGKQLIFGYHLHDDKKAFHRVVEVSFADDDWRLKCCILLTNMTRILNCLIHYAVPLTCSPAKRSLVNDIRVQKVYKDDSICGISTVENMVQIYKTIADFHVPHTDQLVSLETDSSTNTTVCQFAPIGRSYLPMNVEELLDALVCVTQALVVLHSHKIMHRDIRWANVFHALDKNNELSFTREFVLFDFEYAAKSPQPSFGQESLLVHGNHAPEMFASSSSSDDVKYKEHTTSVDIWSIGFLLVNAHVDVPISHADDLHQLQETCMNPNPVERPTAVECLDWLLQMQRKPFSKEKDVQTLSSVPDMTGLL